MQAFASSVETAFGLLGLLLVAFEVYATVLRARKRPGPLSEKLNRSLWWLVTKLSGKLSRSARHALLESVGPLLLPVLAVLLVLVAIVSFGLLYAPRFPAQFHSATSSPLGLGEVFYFSGVTLLTIGYGDVAPNSHLVQVFALVEGFTGLAVLSLFTAYLLTVNEAVQTKRSAALSLHIQAQKGADVPGLIAHHLRRGRFTGSRNWSGKDRAMRKPSWNCMLNILSFTTITRLPYTRAFHACSSCSWKRLP